MNKWFRYLAVFLIVFTTCAFLTTCSILLLVSGTNIDFQTLITERALLGFLNVVFISVLVTAISLYTSNMMERSAKRRILKGVEAIASGDFSHRIEVPNPGQGFLFYQEIGESINRMAAELESSETLRTDFIANVSHELKSPLASISAYCELLQDSSQTDKEREEKIHLILHMVRKLSDLITNILKMSKLENQQIYPNIKTYNLSRQVAECFLSFEDRWEKKALEIETDIEDDVLVKADEELLFLVWNNLISNAIKFTEQGGLIKISLKDYGDEIVVAVQDTGCGIPPETGRHIFDKFYQGDTSHATEGNGLGLCLVKRIIEILEGRIDVESEVGKGSTFTVHINK